jgi:hypothetical protein
MPDVRIGAQLPRLVNAPQGPVSDGPDATELAGLCGLHLDPWQAYALDCLLQKRADGRWVTKTGLLVVPRQNGKGAVLEAWELFRLFSLNVREVRHTAHLAKTAKDAFEKMRFRVKESDLLTSRLMPDRSKGIRTSNGEWGFTFRTGQKLTYTTRSEGFARGETLSDVIIDECQHLTDSEMSDVSFTMATKPYGQTLMTGSAPMPGKSEVMRRLMAAARAGSQSVTCLEWSIDGRFAVDLDDRELWAAANPGYGIRLLDEEICNERVQNSDEDFARERLGIVAEDGGTLFPPGSWDSLVDRQSTITGRPTFAVEVSEDRSWGCIGAAGEGPVGIHVEVGENRRDVGWIVPRAVEIAGKNPHSSFVVQRSSAAGALIPALQDAGVRVLEASVADYVQACGMFFDAVAEKALRHLGQAEVDTAVRGATKRASGDAFKWDRRNPNLDISPLAAETLAYWGHVTNPPVDLWGSVF